eukprot:3064555-Rhodomonas_salina.1
MAANYCVKGALLPTVSQVRYGDFMDVQTELEPIGVHLRMWDEPDSKDESGEDEVEDELDFGAYAADESNASVFYDRFVCQSEIAVGDQPELYEFEVDPVAQGFMIAIEGCCGRFWLQRQFFIAGEQVKPFGLCEHNSTMLLPIFSARIQSVFPSRACLLLPANSYCIMLLHCAA